jgi:molecular chaperone DnaK
MVDALLDFYRHEGLALLETTLQSVVGQGREQVRDPKLYRMHVIEHGWNALPDRVRAIGREKLRWDEILLLLRREVYGYKGGRVRLRADAATRMRATLEQLLGGQGQRPATAPRSESAGRGQEALDDAVGKWLLSENPTEGPIPSTPEPARDQPAPEKPAPAGSATTSDEPPAAAATALGIDLGTTYSVVAYLDAQGRPVSLPNPSGELLTPSVVLFADDGVVVGKEAVRSAAIEPDRVADCVKRDMGSRSYHRKINDRELPPEVISAFVLRSLRADAERRLGPLQKAVITVPAYFDEVRRRATMDAGRIAGLDVLDIINEPTAAAIAYGYQLGFLDRQGQTVGEKPVRVLVYDLGGGTFDVTILEIQGTSFKALATDGDVYLGGKDWDEQLMEIAAERFQKLSGSDPRADPATVQELWLAVEAGKRTLSERPRAPVYLNYAGRRHKTDITREEFEEATAPLLGRTQATTELVLRQAGLSWADIDRVLLIGGSTRMPMVRRMLQEVTGKRPEQSISPDEAVAHGAALYADLLLQRQTDARRPARFSITNVNSHSLGIIGFDPHTKQKRNQILIPKNSPLPCTATKVFKTSQPNQPMVTIRVVEGESDRPDACSQVGVCTIRDLPPNLPEGYPVQVSYSYQENGRLRVLAKLEGLPAMVTTYFLRDNSLPETDLRGWLEYVAEEWKKRNEGDG